MKAIIDAIVNVSSIIYNFLSSFVYEPIKNSVNWQYEESFPFTWVFVLTIVLLVLILWGIKALIKRFRKRKIKFYVGKKLVAKTKTRYKKPIKFEQVNLDCEGKTFVGWYKNKKLTKPYESNLLNVKKNLKLYAKFEMAEPQPVLVNSVKKIENTENVKETNQTKVETVNQVENPVIKEPANMVEDVKNPTIEGVDKIEVGTLTTQESQVAKEEIIVQSEIGNYYDELRYNLLSYERASAFKKLGVVAKQIIAEMFELNGEINLYLNVNPELMKSKGFNVEKYDNDDFKIVPCKKVVKNNEDYIEAINLIEEVMTFNNLIKSDVVLATKTVSDEKTRKSGFAFFVKNEVVASTVEDYYRLLRAIVLSYSVPNGSQVDESLNNKIILKIFKKQEQLFIYLNAKDKTDNLEFVGYDKNFIDTPYKFEVKSTNDFTFALELIEGIMSESGMVKLPSKAEISFDDKVETNCGFGYRIKN